jgi:hypothetical protein
MREQPNQRALTLAFRLEKIIAVNITNGVRQLEGERISAQQGPARGETSGRSSSETSTTERNASEAYRLGLMIEEIRDAIAGAEIAVKYLDELTMQACKTRAFGALDPIDDLPPKIPLCRDGQFGRSGVLEWGDPLCLRAAVKAGLCGKEYIAWYRYRKAHGIDTNKDFEAA